MASTTALLTGLSGLNANARRLEVIGNNIANINTTSFKSNRLLFSPTLSRNFSLGTSPSSTSGGTNPGQVGLGVGIAGTQRNFNNGGISTTGVNTDMAIQGDGFFIVDRGGQRSYTRSGSFQLNSARDLVTVGGERVQGFAVDQNFRVVEGQLTNINIPVGSLTLAEATKNVFLSGNLNADLAGLPTQGATVSFDQIFNNLTSGSPMVGTDTFLDNMDDPANPGTALFPTANEPYKITISGALKGNKPVPNQTFNITTGTTVDNFIEFLNDTFGIVTGLTNPDGSTSGAQIDSAGKLKIVGNAGSVNNITFSQANIKVVDSASASTTPFTMTQNPATGIADGESVRTSFIVFDSLGTPVQVDLALVFDSANGAGTTWRFFADSTDNVNIMNPDLNIGTGTVTFDNFGQLVTNAPILEVVQRNSTGALDPMSFGLNFKSGNDNVTSLVASQTGAQSAVSAVLQDGSGIGTLSSFSVGQDGVMTGAFTNGLTRVIGQIAMARFTNSEGLVDAGSAMFRIGPNSGTALVTTPGAFGTGRIIGGSLELSNVDLGEEFTKLILTTTGYSAASRVITTTDQLLQQLVAIGR